jgi:membrane associated rhomboid family serine protease
MLPLRDNVPTRTFPVVTVALIAINVAVWLFYQLPNLDRSVHDLAFHPCEVNGSCAQIDKGWPLTALTSMFMHGSWLHIGGNMLFLWIFGNNVEDAFGHIRFLVWYIAAGIAAAGLQTFVTLAFADAAGASIPNVGASGAIAGVLGAYFVLLPTASVLTAFIIIFFVFLREIPAMWFLGIWIVFQLWEGGFSILQPQAGGGVAFFAHIGGFAFGVATAYLMRKQRPLAPKW